MAICGVERVENIHLERLDVLSGEKKLIENLEFPINLRDTADQVRFNRAAYKNPPSRGDNLFPFPSDRTFSSGRNTRKNGNVNTIPVNRVPEKKNRNKNKKKKKTKKKRGKRFNCRGKHFPLAWMKQEAGGGHIRLWQRSDSHLSVPVEFLSVSFIARR